MFLLKTLKSTQKLRLNRIIKFIGKSIIKALYSGSQFMLMEKFM